MWHNGMTQSQHCNKDKSYNDDNEMRVVWIICADRFNVKNRDIWEGNVTTRREILTKHIPFP